MLDGPTFKALMEACRKQKRGDMLTQKEQVLLLENPLQVREPEEDLSLGTLADALEALDGLPEKDGFVFLAGIPRSLGLRR